MEADEAIGDNGMTMVSDLLGRGFSTRELAEMLGVGDRAVLRWSHAGSLEPVGKVTHDRLCWLHKTFMAPSVPQLKALRENAHVTKMLR